MSTGRLARLRAVFAFVVLGCTSISVHGGSADLTWSPPTTNTDGSALTNLSSYRIYTDCGVAGYPQTFTIPAPAAGHALDGLPDGAVCRFVVSALNSTGVESAFSNEASKTFPAVPVANPTAGPLITWREAPVVALSKAFAIAAGNADNGGAFTTGTFDSTGFTHVVAAFKHEGAAATLTPSDNKGSSAWTSLTKISHGNGDLHSQLFWAPIGTPGTGHTVTITPSASRPFRSVLVWLIAADTTLELDDETGAAGNGSAVDAGSLATAGVDVVSFHFIGPYAGGSYTPSAGWTEDHDGALGSVSFYGASRGPETTSPIDPAATWTNTDDWASVAAAFREAAGGGGLSIPVAMHYRRMKWH